ncbi:MAG: uracil-DNA glycosylase [Elusimicrobia bacterium]|nr:uracil-DNA glycosylase [Elusimicrobiota bacterium]
MALAGELRRRIASPEAAEECAPARGPKTAAARPAQPLDKAAALAVLSGQAEACRACPLGGQRIRSVFGVGSPEAKVIFIGEGPGFEEDRKGEPFVGKAGQLLDRILASIGLSRQTVYIANVVKCHPMKDPSTPEARGNDRAPTPVEMEACHHFLDRQIAIIRPRFLVSLGAVATKALLGSDEPLGRVRGRWREYRKGDVSARLLPTYHPAALLRNPDLKRDVWEDMKNLRAELEGSHED